ncbi:putative coenzyme A biosynthesis bifunctional protein CoaBC [Virgibacillus pantothenticus]|uniref:Coenzyme A biosynthesis bifunctional protein CoaBC n=1 Tax=Virgibacillus pantothenticus TaxID=1473 RepID=A0A0L0QND6_VIRPA|nr:MULTISPECIES: bifunctional phosphopantothenoylcysteine decarboxylase/phosphopantothenate--cysteine ligase CoaBC [Virgibacillus]API93832.1 bifunctional 4'-phosphopantothenoylcysteine decarboxylase/phosphopantothenoylcysteine synthetase [Virgibacillus sp. 6R]KNE20117.1 phosphopantothenoylcysteine decarboxylase [Virgibacillus pantothenticus]MBS7427623.1 bifunctional phosphopantothenoylcysteine decarboxylase/phosphopantothenate--cysteine ligase CoaBC [Virgibacillus sp. 19R1-5]MBU8565886.1 bifunc
MVHSKNIVLGVSGGIAAYKACSLASKLTQKGANVKVVMTDNATKFVAPLTFQALSRNPVFTDTFDEKDPTKIAHIDVADWADIVILAPATANIIGKLANGIADDMLSTILLATQAAVYIAPAMNVHMYAHPAVIKNMQTLVDWGYHFIEPGAGYLACGYVGKGRLEEPATIIETIEAHQQQKENLFLTGKHVLVSAGPTQEKIDPVRYFTNRSSGKMGFALAEVAANAGASVTLVAGPSQVQIQHAQITKIDVTTAEEMYESMLEHFGASDIIIKAAAVADYRPAVTYEQKMKKQAGPLQIHMERTRDILQALGEQKAQQFLVGFAAETERPIENGRKKLERKNLDAIVINDISADGAGFAGDTNAVTYLNKRGKTETLGLNTKQEIARQILQLIHEDVEAQRS